MRTGVRGQSPVPHVMQRKTTPSLRELELMKIQLPIYIAPNGLNSKNDVTGSAYV